MCKFRRSCNADKTLKDRDLIEHNSKLIETAIIGVNNNDNIYQLFLDIKEKLKYLVPSGKCEVYEYDRAIEKKIIELNRKIKNTKEFNIDLYADMALEIQQIIADRNSII